MKTNILVKFILFFALSLFVFFYLIIFAANIYEAAIFPRSPSRVTLSQAVELDHQNKPMFLFFGKPLYVSITDAVWECASVKQVDAPGSKKDHTDGVFSNLKNDAVVFVQLEGLFTCQELQEMEVPGKLMQFTKRPVEYESDREGKVVINEDSEAITYELCMHCTPSESRFTSVFFLLFPFIMWGIFENAKRRQQRQNVS